MIRPTARLLQRRRGVRIIAAASFAICFSFPARAEPASTPSVRAADPWRSFIDEAATRFSVPASWIRAVIRIESHGNPRAVSAKGAVGLMQLMPDTYAELRVRYGLGDDPKDAHDNILAGTAYLHDMHQRFGTEGFIDAYNAGPQRYQDHLATGRPLAAETVAYVADLTPLLSGAPPADNRTRTTTDQVSWQRAPASRTASCWEVMREGDARSKANVTTQRRSRVDHGAPPLADENWCRPRTTERTLSCLRAPTRQRGWIAWDCL